MARLRTLCFENDLHNLMYGSCICTRFHRMGVCAWASVHGDMGLVGQRTCAARVINKKNKHQLAA